MATISERLRRVIAEGIDGEFAPVCLCEDAIAYIEKLEKRYASAEVILGRCKQAVVYADSELSAYGHGRPLDRDIALEVSDLCRKSYKDIVAWLLEVNDGVE